MGDRDERLQGQPMDPIMCWPTDSRSRCSV